MPFMTMQKKHHETKAVARFIKENNVRKETWEKIQQGKEAIKSGRKEQTIPDAK